MRAAIAAASMLLVILSGTARAQEKDLTELDLATLMGMDVKITSAAMREQSGSDAAAAVFVLTREDIRRNGATSIPELLRVVPGLHVARIANSRWAVTARGFNGQFANKLLVLVDGRIIYAPLFSGVLWEDQQVPIEEIERIEVIRGPGGALWGANAVNGIINIITRSAAAMNGLAVSASGGNEESTAAAIRFGASAGTANDYRLYAEHFERDSLIAAGDPWRRTQVGGRWDRTMRNAMLSVQGDLYYSEIGDYLRTPGVTPGIRDEGGSLNAHLNGLPLAHGTVDLRASFSTRQRTKFSQRSEQETVAALDAKYAHPRTGRHLWTLGASTRSNSDDLSSAPGVNFDPRSVSQQQWAVYAQDEIFFLEDALRITAGAKLEDPGAGGSALQPTLRALWHLNPRHVLWGAMSRAVRSPSRFETGGRVIFLVVPGDPPVVSRLFGDPGLKEESMRAGELGWRWRPRERFTFDLALFQHRYKRLIAIGAGTPVFDPGPPATIFVDARHANLLDAHTHGAEASLDWIASPSMRFQASITTLTLHLPPPDGILNTFVDVDAEHASSVRAEFRLPWQTRLDLAWRNVGALPGYGVDEYHSVDLQLSWAATPKLEFSARVDNLFDERHIEYFDVENQVPGDVLGRSAFVRIDARF